jgi:hypothetical protein
MKITEHNVTTGAIIEREASAEELTQYEADQIADIAAQEAKATRAAVRAALLEKLGITEDEAKLLLS